MKGWVMAALERDVSYKYCAPGIGLIKDDEFELTEGSGERR